uniref:Putative Phage/plasmid primase P4, C-terminal n=1 Tax=mine drainage metagenome TaxID=410659 RepID=E6PPZ0_9ZZZZ
MTTTKQARCAAGASDQGDGDVKPSPELVFSMMIEDNHNYSSDGAILYFWDGLVWRPQDPGDVEKKAFRWLGMGKYQDKATPRVASSCSMAALINARPLPKFADDEKIILPVQNGYLHIDLKEGEISLQAPDRGYGLSYSIECNYDPDAQAAEFHAFISSVLPDPDVRGYIQEYAGYTLMPDSRFQTAMWWLGGGSNGKSTLAEIIAALHSKISTISLDSLDGFALVSLLGSSMVWADETPRRINEQRLKTLISGGPVQIDRKFKEPISLRSTAKWILCGNDLPVIIDQTHGFWRRFAVVQFEKKFEGSGVDVLLPERIIKNELSGVLNWALEGLLRLTSRGKFPVVPVLMQEAEDGAKREANNVLAWWQDGRAELCSDFVTSRNVIYGDYRLYTQMTGTAAVGEERFWRRLKQIVPGIDPKGKQKKLNGKPVRFMNMRLTDAASAMAQDRV